MPKYLKLFVSTAVFSLIAFPPKGHANNSPSSGVPNVFELIRLVRETPSDIGSAVAYLHRSLYIELFPGEGNRSYHNRGFMLGDGTVIKSLDVYAANPRAARDAQVTIELSTSPCVDTNLLARQLNIERQINNPLPAPSNSGELAQNFYMTGSYVDGDAFHSLNISYRQKYPFDKNQRCGTVISFGL